MEGYERIKELYLNLPNKDNALIKITTFLMKTKGMNELYLNEEKNLQDMIRFIREKARLQAVNNVAAIDDNEVYKMALYYFSKSNEEIGFNKLGNDTTAATAEQLKLEI